MKYRLSLPEHNDNISDRHPLGEFALLSTGLALLFGLVYLVMGFLVDIASDSISFETEAALFKAISFQYEFTADDHNSDRERLQQTVDRLQECTALPYPIKVHVVNSEVPNAVALPGGNIAVFSGLLKAVPKGGGLAFVLAHELGHFNNRDHLRGLGRSLVLYALSSLITGGDSAISSLLAPSAGFSTAQYSQGRERLADDFALDTLFCSEGSVAGAADFFEYMLAQKEETDIKLLHFFDSHPKTRERIESIKRYSASQGYLQH